MLRMEIALFLVVAFVAYMYFTAEKEHTALHKTFSVLPVAVLVHLALDGCTVYTVNHLDTVPMLLNGALHRLFLGSMAAVIYLFYQYIAILVQEETGKPRQLDWPAKAFLVLAELGNFLLPISYTVTAEGNYSAGLTCWFPMPPWPFTCCCAPDFWWETGKPSPEKSVLPSARRWSLSLPCAYCRDCTTHGLSVEWASP